MRLIKLEDVFEVKYGPSLALNSMSISDQGIPFVSRQEKNNGVVARVEEIEGIDTNPPHTLSVAASGSVLATFYQPEPYYSAYHVFYLTPKAEMTVMEMLIYSKIINSNKYKYSYGRQANKTLKKLLIPDRIEIKTLCNRVKMLEKPSRESVCNSSFSLNTQNWKDFKCSELFEIDGTKTTPISELEKYGEGEYPYVTT
ncbi:MAG: restriction endonuclease subunit S [Candidatus Dadabacteria bacterium]|nr:restriction endonuclease subunit S [Candidatus Dadabacteria bacterium]